MRFYNILLHLYPASFRSEYGSEMSSLFAERRRMASNAFAVIALWIETFFEILFNAALVHWDILRQDLRYSVRGLTRSSGYALTAIAVTALGIGATTAVFSVTDHVLIRSLIRIGWSSFTKTHPVTHAENYLHRTIVTGGG
jgi:hypothetical protein